MEMTHKIKVNPGTPKKEKNKTKSKIKKETLKRLYCVG